MIFIETSKFTELVKQYLSDEEYSALQWLLLRRPDSGAVVSGSGGVRKIRWGLSGRGKSGGYPGYLLLEETRWRDLDVNALC